MFDSVLVANEVVDDLRRLGKSGLCVKVDYENVYDLVRWECMYDMMHKLGFNNVWIKQIKGCMESASIFVLVSDNPTTDFKPFTGLRQGDHLAHFLFLIAAEGLIGLARQAIKFNLLKGVKLGRHEVETCVLQFANDTFFMCEDSHQSIFTIKFILRCFELALGLKINFHKSNYSYLILLEVNW